MLTAGLPLVLAALISCSAETPLTCTTAYSPRGFLVSDRLECTSETLDTSDEGRCVLDCAEPYTPCSLGARFLFCEEIGDVRAWADETGKMFRLGLDGSCEVQCIRL